MKLCELAAVHGGIVRVSEIDEYTMQLHEVYYGTVMTLLNHPGEVVNTYTTNRNDISILNINVKGWEV